MTVNPHSPARGATQRLIANMIAQHNAERQRERQRQEEQREEQTQLLLAQRVHDKATWDAMPMIAHLVVRASVIRAAAPPSLFPHHPPHLRTACAEVAHVMCAAVSRAPGVLARYITEVNTFWQSVYRHEEAQRLADWKPPESLGEVSLPLEMTETQVIDRMVWDSLSQIEVNPKQ